MILTNCAACAAPLAHNAPRCVRCKVRYCDRNGREHPEAKSLEMNLRNARMFQMMPRPGDPPEADEVAPPQDGIDRDGLRDLMRSFSPRATADEIDAACDTLDPDGSGADRFMMQAINQLTEAFDISHV